MYYVEKGVYNQWKESIVVPVYKKVDKTECGTSLITTPYKMLSSILHSGLSPYKCVDEITGNHQLHEVN
jgi:hypothetical protein